MGLDLRDKRFGKLIGIKPSHKIKTNWFWLFKCDCGNSVVKNGSKVNIGRIISCGCEINKPQHGHTVNRTVTPTYKSWSSMFYRLKNDPHYTNVYIDPRWNKFEHFLADMGERPSLSYTLDRIKNELGYRPGNCKWSNKQQQAFNRRSRVKTSRYFGVCYRKDRDVWLSQCTLAFRKQFKTEIEAALAYDEKAKEIWGDEAILNFPP